MSVHEAAAKARAARLDPRVRSWAIDALVRYGAPRGDLRAMTNALLLHERATKLYVPDPVDGEYIVSPECLLGTCGGIRFDGGDCDDLAAGLAAGLMSVGIRSAIIGQGYPKIGHVLVGAHVGDRWLRADPTENLPLGEAPRAHNEVWVDALTGETLCNGERCLDTANIAAPPVPRGSQGDYVGVSGSPQPALATGDATSRFWWFMFGAMAGGSAVAAVAFLRRRLP